MDGAKRKSLRMRILATKVFEVIILKNPPNPMQNKNSCKTDPEIPEITPKSLSIEVLWISNSPSLVSVSHSSLCWASIDLLALSPSSMSWQA
jgi:hypothetical protein